MSLKLVAIYSSRLFGALGFQIFSIFALLQAYAISPKLGTIGLLGLSTFVSVAAFSFVSGTLVDRLLHKGRYAVALHAGLLAVSLVSLFTPLSSVSSVYLMAFAIGAFRVMRSPVYFVLAKESLNDSSEPERAKRFFIMSWQLAAVVGPLVGGALGLHFGRPALQIAYVTLFALAFISLLPAFSIKGTPVLGSTSWTSDLSESLVFFFRDRVLRDSFLLDTLGVLFAGVAAFLPFLLTQNHLSPEYLGLLRAAQNFGSFAIAFALPTRFQTGRVFLISVTAFALLTTVVPFLHSLTLFFIVFAALGILDGVSILMRDLLLFEKAVPHLQGRIYALNSIFISSSDDLGDMESGLLAQAIGVPATVILGGLCCASLAIYFSTCSKTLWNFQFKGHS